MPKAPVMFEVIESHPGMYHCCMCGKNPATLKCWPRRLPRARYVLRPLWPAAVRRLPDLSPMPGEEAQG